MNQTARTLAFLALAIGSVAIAAGVHYSNKPADIKEFSDVGEKFYPKFEDPNEATGLRVASYNDATGKTDVFSVEFKDGLWRIPSHHSYPADGEDRLAKTAASMVGVTRQALVETTSAAHRRHKLLDPLDKEVAGTEGRGDRITLMKGDEVLVDFIVGEKVEGQGNVYYVRRANEDRFYLADLGNFTISTNFADWIEKDVLDITSDSIKELVINRYYVDEAQGRVVSEGQLRLNRPSQDEDWKLDGLDESKEKLKTVDLNNMIAALNDLKIDGVRPKPAGFSAGLKSGGPLSIDPLTEHDLQTKGFFIANGRFISNEGEVNVGSNDGVFYTLGFGEEFSGSSFDIEVGGQKSEDAEKESGEEGKENAEGEEKNEQLPPGHKKSRYLFVTVQFDEELLGGAPVAPVKPEPPAENAATEGAEEPEEGEKADGPESKSNSQKAYDEALQRYEEELEVYEIQKKDYEEKVEKGKERVAELNRRFADWFYVMSESVFDRLKLKRDALVEPAEPPMDESTEAAGAPAAESESEESVEVGSTESGDAAPAETPPEESAVPESEADPAAEPPVVEAPETPTP